MLTSSNNTACALWRLLVDLAFLVSTIIVGMMVLILVIALRIVRLLVATAAGLAVLASAMITAAWLCGITKSMNLLFWFYAAGLLLVYCGLLLLREKIAELPVWMIRRRDYARHLTAPRRADGFRSAAPSRDL